MTDEKMRAALERLVSEEAIYLTGAEKPEDWVGGRMEVRVADILFARQTLASAPVNQDEVRCSTCGQTNAALVCSNGFHAMPATGDGAEDVVVRLGEIIYHADGFTDSLDTISEPPVWLAAALTEKHSGDCTKQPRSCTRCHAEEYLKIARYVAARWPALATAVVPGMVMVMVPTDQPGDGAEDVVTLTCAECDPPGSGTECRGRPCFQCSGNGTVRALRTRSNEDSGMELQPIPNSVEQPLTREQIAILESQQEPDAAPTDQPATGDGAEDVVERLMDEAYRSADCPAGGPYALSWEQAKYMVRAAFTATAVVPEMVMVPLRAVEHLLWAKDRRPETLAFADEAWQEIRAAVPTQARAEGITND